ncbi:MAG: CDP-archaeol synthase, partial [Gammaproteobacteria bacterium]
MNTLAIAKCLILLLTANGAPIVARNLLGNRCSWPIDAGVRAPDGRPVFGPAKTWRGVAGAILATAFVAILIGQSIAVGAAFALLAMCGDLVSSFIKRRLGKRSSDPALLLDQIPEAAFPAVALAGPLALTTPDIVAVVIGFAVADMVLSRALYW